MVWETSQIKFPVFFIIPIIIKHIFIHLHAFFFANICMLPCFLMLCILFLSCFFSPSTLPSLFAEWVQSSFPSISGSRSVEFFLCTLFLLLELLHLLPFLSTLSFALAFSTTFQVSPHSFCPPFLGSMSLISIVLTPHLLIIVYISFT